jgi:hypothetical protein
VSDASKTEQQAKTISRERMMRVTGQISRSKPSPPPPADGERGRPPVQNCKFISQGFHLTDRSHFGQALQMTRLADWEWHNPIAWEGSQSEHQEVKIVWTFLYWKQHYLRVGHEFIFGFGSAHRRV